MPVVLHRHQPTMKGMGAKWVGDSHPNDIRNTVTQPQPPKVHASVSGPHSQS